MSIYQKTQDRSGWARKFQIGKFVAGLLYTKAGKVWTISLVIRIHKFMFEYKCTRL